MNHTGTWIKVQRLVGLKQPKYLIRGTVSLSHCPSFYPQASGECSLGVCWAEGLGQGEDIKVKSVVTGSPKTGEISTPFYGGSLAGLVLVSPRGYQFPPGRTGDG